MPDLPSPAAHPVTQRLGDADLALKQIYLRVTQPTANSEEAISLFEVCAVTMSGLNLRSERSAEHRLKDAVVSLVRDEDFQHAITYSTNSTLPVQKRFEAMEGAVKKVIA